MNGEMDGARTDTRRIEQDSAWKVPGPVDGVEWNDPKSLILNFQKFPKFFAQKNRTVLENTAVSQVSYTLAHPT